MQTPSFATAAFGRERLAGGVVLARHRHAGGYAAVVVDGAYEEAGDEGRRRVRAGQVLVHRAFEAHLDSVARHGAEVLNLPLPEGRHLPVSFAVADVDLLVRVAEREGVAVAAELLQPAGAAAAASDWPDLLAAALRAAPSLRLDAWAAEHRLAPATLSRGFRAAYGVSPARYRAEARARCAFEALLQGRLPMAQLAAETGFADQAHFCRAIRQLTGAPPGAWQHVKSVQDAARAATLE